MLVCLDSGFQNLAVAEILFWEPRKEHNDNNLHSEHRQTMHNTKENKLLLFCNEQWREVL